MGCVFFEFQCFMTDRLILVDSTGALEANASCLQEYNRYYAGIQFDGLDNDAEELTPLTTYRIRMMPTLTDGTNKIMDR